MTASDPTHCRRALREIGEIAAVAVLQDSQMSDQEALQSIAAIAAWADDAPSGYRAECGPVIHALHRLTQSVDIEALPDQEAVRLFERVIQAMAVNGGAARVLANEREQS